MDLPDFGFLEFFKSDDHKIAAVIIICVTLLIRSLFKTTLKFIKDDRADRRRYQHEDKLLQHEIKKRQLELFGEELNLDD
ncbi:hypothetical protein WH95_18405 [Kiloniella litopenaei]|uniref:Uncharacterized protein n=1 Tax=Kiloniella litopenaei TaxID=1549748 RepID=A0A0M2R5Z2_9PROT|nr:hypothetical protein [Kiloniella litopenaei]KKJ75415.1 hypothetical protein WH95_18405 [Kiloniella litopenaei]